MTSEDRDSTHHDDGTGSRSSASSESGSDTGRGSKRSKKQKQQLPLWQETILLAVVALVMAVVVKSFLVQAFYIPSESMEPGLVKNDRILVQKPSYWGSGEPQRGDVVVFKDPGGWLPEAAATSNNLVAKAMTKIGLYPEGGHLVKRVIGVEGDVIDCCDEDGNISVNGVPLKEFAYVKDDPQTQCNGPMPGTCDWTAGPVPEGSLFMMGDNRGHSGDSTARMCSDDETDCVEGREFVPVDLVVGRLLAVIWPFDRMRLDRRPDSFAAVDDAG